MTELLTQSFLRHNPLGELTARYGIAVRRHREFPTLVFLKYNQIESPMAEPIVQECRGLILDEADGWRVISFPFRKFFNHGEGHAAPIDWPSATVYEKIDGSLIRRHCSHCVPERSSRSGSTSRFARRPHWNA